MSNKELTARVKLDIQDAETKLKRLDKLIKDINKATTGRENTRLLEDSLAKKLVQTERIKQATLRTKQMEEKHQQAVNGTKVSQERVNQAVLRTELLTDRVTKNAKKNTQETENWVVSLNKATGALTKCKSLLGTLTSRLGKIASLVLGIGTIKLAIQGADDLTGAQNKFNNIAAKQLGDSAYTKDSSGNITGYSDVATNFTQSTMDKIYNSAQKTRVLYSDMLSNVSKTMTLAPDAFKGNIDNAIRFQEIMAEAYAVGGASAAEMSTSMYQLTQALGAGTLAGDELRSVREGAPLAYQKIEEFAQGVLNSDKSLKDLASQGKITSDIVVAAVMSMGSEMDQAFALTKERFTDVWNQIKSAAQKAFEPVVRMLTTKLNEAMENGLIQKVEKFFKDVANWITSLAITIENVAKWVADNWNWLKDVIVAGLILIATYEAMLATVQVIHLITTIKHWKDANVKAWQYLLTILKIVAVVALCLIAIYLLHRTWSDFAHGAITLGEAIIKTLLIIAVLGMLIAFIFGYWVVGLVILAVGLILATIVWLFEYICYGVAFLAAVIVDALSIIWNIILFVLQLIVSSIVYYATVLLNIAIGILNGILQAVWLVCDVILSIVEFILNCCNNGFNSFGGAVANLIGQIISWFLALGKVVTTIIDAIFGTNWTAGLSSLQDTVRAWGKNEEVAVTLERPSWQIPTLDADGVASATFNWMGGAHTGLANPLDWGSAAKNWGSNLMDYQLPATGGGSQWWDNMADALGIGGNSELNPTSIDDLLNELNKLNENGENTADNTGKIADSMELTEEDLAYLRKLADMEWKKEYTTASITIDMSNYNTISGDNDLDGIVTKLSDKLREELNVFADGVYA